jgi:hypothetical protein
VVPRHFSLFLLLAFVGCAHPGLPVAYVAPGPYGAWSPAAEKQSATTGAPVEPWQRSSRPAASRERGLLSHGSHPTRAVARTGPATGSGIGSGADIPGGAKCLRELTRRGVRYEVLEARPGLDTPVSIRVPLGGVYYDTWGDGALVCDCRLAVALAELGPELREIGVTRLRFSGAYVYRTVRSGKRLSLHAHGLAIDIHDVTVNGVRLSVKRDFARGRDVDGGCERLPPINQVACRAQARGLFKELLTPDSDADHHDHLHFAVAPLES